MYGNVWEFTSTCDYYYSSDFLIASGYPNPDRCMLYILKGGSASSRANQMSDTAEYFKRVGGPESFAGFRLIMDDPSPGHSTKN